MRKDVSWATMVTQAKKTLLNIERADLLRDTKGVRTRAGNLDKVTKRHGHDFSLKVKEAHKNVEAGFTTIFEGQMIALIDDCDGTPQGKESVKNALENMVAEMCQVGVSSTSLHDPIWAEAKKYLPTL